MDCIADGSNDKGLVKASLNVSLWPRLNTPDFELTVTVIGWEHCVNSNLRARRNRDLNPNDMLTLALVFPATMLIFKKVKSISISGIGRMKWSYLDSHWNVLRDSWTSLNPICSTNDKSFSSPIDYEVLQQVWRDHAVPNVISFPSSIRHSSIPSAPAKPPLPSELSCCPALDTG